MLCRIYEFYKTFGLIVLLFSGKNIASKNYELSINDLQELLWSEYNEAVAVWCIIF